MAKVTHRPGVRALAVLFAAGWLTGCKAEDSGSDGDGGVGGNAEPVGGEAAGGHGADHGEGPGGTPSGGDPSPVGGGTPPAGGDAPSVGGVAPPAGGEAPPAGGESPPVGGEGPPAGGAEPPAGDCAAACERFVDCAAGGACACLPDNLGASLSESCLTACGNTPELSAALTGAATCDDVVGIVAQGSAQFDRLCNGVDGSCGGPGPGPEPVPQIPECETFGEVVAACTVEACAPAGAYLAGLEATLRYSCNQQVDSGDLTADDVAGISGLGCDDLAQITDQLVSDNLASLCAGNGPATPDETCNDACDFFIECIGGQFPEGSAEADPGLCRFSCAAGADATDTFQCLADAAECADVNMCGG